MKRVARVTEQLIEDLRRSRGVSSAQAITPRVLIIEDDPSDAMLLQRVLNQIGCDVSLAHNGYEALAVVEKSICPDQPDFDIVFLDLGLPGMSGTHILQKIRALNKSLPVIIVTGDTESHARLDIGQSGYVSLVQKPLNREDASEILSKHKIA